MPALRPLAVAAALLAAAAGAHAAGHVLQNGRLSVTFGDTAVWSFSNGDRVDAITWIDSAGHARSGYVANGGPAPCGDPEEYFGQSYGEPENTDLHMIDAGVHNTWADTGTLQGTVSTSWAHPCPVLEVARTKTTYRMGTASSVANELQVTRLFEFDAGGVIWIANGLRAYVPRLPLATYPFVLVPNATGTAIGTFDANDCGADCEITDWNGRWFADDDGAGNGMLVVRSTSSTAPAILAINNDGASQSNLSSVVLLQPAGGWTSWVTEVEYLCFYDLASWPVAARRAGRLPQGCAATTP